MFYFHYCILHMLTPGLPTGFEAGAVFRGESDFLDVHHQGAGNPIPALCLPMFDNRYYFGRIEFRAARPDILAVFTNIFCI